MKRKRIKLVAIMLTIIMCINFIVPVNAHASDNSSNLKDMNSENVIAEGSCGENSTWILYDTGELIISGQGAIDDLTRKDAWRKYFEDVCSVKIEDGITSIGEDAFYNCYNITEVQVADTVTEIKKAAFYNCNRLMTINLPDNLTEINSSTFWQCYNLRAIVLPSKITQIGDWAFYDCESFMNIVFPDELKVIGDRAFARCYNLKSIDLPDRIETIGSGAFAFDTKLQKINLNKNNQFFSVKDGVLFNKDQSELLCCPGAMDNYYSMPDTVKEIDMFGFAGCEKLEYIVNLNNIAKIGGFAFNECKNLKQINLGENITYLSEEMFGECKNLESVSFSDKVGEFELFPFLNCDSLKDIYYGGTEEQWEQIKKDDLTHPSPGDYDCLYNATIHYNSALKDPEIEKPDPVIPDVKIEKGVKYFSSWDPDKQVAYFGNNDYTGSTVTNQTDTSFMANVDELVNKYVLVSTKDREDNLVDSKQLVSIEPVESIFGKVTNVNGTSVTINENTYNASPEYEFLEFTDLKNEKCIVHLYDREIVGIEKLKEESGVVTEWNENTGELNVNVNNDKKIYKLSYFTDEKKFSIPSSEKVKILCDNENLFYEVYPQKSEETIGASFSIGKDNFKFTNSPNDFLTVDEQKIWADCLNQKESVGYRLAAKMQGRQQYFPIQITDETYNKLVDGVDEKTKEEIYEAIHSENWGGSCYGMCLVMLIRYLEENRLPISFISPNADTTHDLLSPKDSDVVEDIVNYYQLLYKYPQIADYAVSLTNEIKEDYLAALEKMIGEIKENHPIVVAIEQNTKGKAAHAVILCSILDETDEYYKVKVCDPNEEDTFTEMILYKKKGLSNKGFHIKYTGSDREDTDKKEYKYIYNYTSDLNKMDLKNYYTGEIALKNGTEYTRPVIKIDAGTNLTLKTSDSSLAISGEADTLVNVYGPYAEMADSNLDADDVPSIYYLNNYENGGQYKLTIQPEKNSGKVNLILDGHSFTIACENEVHVNLDDKSGKIFAESEKEGDISLQITSNKITDEWQYPTVAVDLKDTKNVAMQITETGVDLSGDNLTETLFVAKNDDTIKSSEINTDEQEITIEDSNGNELEVKKNETEAHEHQCTAKWSWTKSENGYKAMADIRCSKCEFNTRKSVEGHLNANKSVKASYTAPGKNIYEATISVIDEKGNDVGPFSDTYIEEVDQLANPFKDVSNDAWYKDAVLWALDYNITTGKTEELFGANDTCTRAEAVTFLWRAAGKPEMKSNIKFSDVKPDAYYANAVTWAAETGVTTGMKDGTFQPDKKCTRAEIVTFMWRMDSQPQPKNTDTKFSDIKSEDYYYNAVLWAVENKITTGQSETKFAPVKSCTRSEIVTFLYRKFNN